MSQNPLNLGLRFLLELAALAALGYWGWTRSSGIGAYLLAIGAPVVAAVLWGTFRPRNEPNRHRPAPVAVPGPVRFLIEAATFGSATLALFVSGATTAAIIFGVVVLFHYALSYDYVVWLLKS